MVPTCLLRDAGVRATPEQKSPPLDDPSAGFHAADLVCPRRDRIPLSAAEHLGVLPRLLDLAIAQITLDAPRRTSSYLASMRQNTGEQMAARALPVQALRLWRRVSPTSLVVPLSRYRHKYGNEQVTSSDISSPHLASPGGRGTHCRYVAEFMNQCT